MKRFIRWQGLVAFVVLLGIVVGGLYFFAESLTKKAIIKSAEATFGAEVNISEVLLGYSPLKLTVVDLQVTDSEKPEQNLFSFKQAAASVDVWQYLFGKVIIDELEVSQLAFSTVRAKPGEVYLTSAADDSAAEDSLADQAKEMLPEVDMKLPDVKTLLNDDNLITVKAGNALQQSYKVEQEKLAVLKAELPNKAKIKTYQNKVKALGKMKVNSLADIEKIKTEFEAIKAEFRADQALVKKAKKQVSASKTLLAQQLSTVKDGPAKDWQQIEKTYQLESIDTEDFAHILFGEQAREYVTKAKWAYEKVAPFISSSEDGKNTAASNVHAKGRFVYFKEDTPLPSMLIKKATFSVATPTSQFAIEASELTHQHWIRGKNSMLAIHSASNGEFNFKTQFNLAKSGDFNSDGNWSISNRTLSDTKLTDSKALTLSLTKAQLDANGDFSLINDRVLATNQLVLNKASYQGEAKSKLTKLLVDTVKSLDSLAIDVGINGLITKPELSISSSLNDALTGAFKEQVAGKLSEFKGKVNKGLNDKLANTLKLGDSQTAELLDLEALLTDTDKALIDLKNSDIVKQQQKKLEDKVKNKAKDKVEDKLKDKLGDLFG